MNQFLTETLRNLFSTRVPKPARQDPISKAIIYHAEKLVGTSVRWLVAEEPLPEPEPLFSVVYPLPLEPEPVSLWQPPDKVFLFERLNSPIPRASMLKIAKIYYHIKNEKKIIFINYA